MFCLIFTSTKNINTISIVQKRLCPSLYCDLFIVVIERREILIHITTCFKLFLYMRGGDHNNNELRKSEARSLALDEVFSSQAFKA